MSASKQLELIPKIYDTLLNEESWGDLLEDFCHVCGAGGSGIVIFDSAHEEISTRKISNGINDPAFWNDYFLTTGKEDIEAFAYASKQPVGVWTLDEEAWGKPSSEIIGNQVIEKRFGLNRRAGTILHKSPVWRAGLSLNYVATRGNMTSEEDATSQIFLPHLAKAIEIGRSFSLLRHRYRTVLNVLDKLKIGLCITTRNGEIVVSNSSADRAFCQNNGLRLSREKKVRVSSSEDQRRLNDYIDRASRQKLATENAVVTVSKRDGHRDWILEVASMTDMDGKIDRDFAGAFVFVIDPDRKDLVSAERMRTIFELTTAEADIAKLLTEGLLVNDIAEMRDVSHETVRSQVKSLLQKTGSKNQTDLVRQALRVVLPIENQ